MMETQDGLLERWHEVWERKGKEKIKEKYTLQDLIDIDGFDKGAGNMTEEVWLKAVGVAIRELELRPNEYLLEVGCGAGAMLLPLSETGVKVTGVDFSSSLIDIAKKIIPNFVGHVGEAANLPYQDNEFDKILSHGVFHYFPDYDYSERVLKEMLRVLKKGGKMLIMDIPDISKKSASEVTRMRSLPEGEHERLYSQYPHLYYDKGWFEHFAQNNLFYLKIFDQEIEGYGNSPFRFNVLMWR
ncbi:TPA: class I SAM-dependent methyltransferase [bacterium]|nr:class I SAM-dependent methyltransferase [bacterium]